MRFSFPRLAFGVLLLNASGGVLFAVLPLFEFQQGGGPILATLIVGAPLLAQTLATFLWGTLSDRWGRRRELLVGGVLAQSVLFLTYPLLPPLGLLFVRILQVFLGATSALATTVATEDPGRTAGRGLGGLSFWGGVGSLAGIFAAYPFLGGVGVSAHSEAAWLLFGLLGALSASSVLFLAWAGELPRPRAWVRGGELLRFRSGPWVLRLSVATVVVGFANYTVFTIFPLYVAQVLTPLGFYGASLNATQQLAVLSLGAAAGGILASLGVGSASDRPGPRRVLFLTAPLVYALLWCGFAFVRNYTVVYLIWAYPASVTFQIPLTREVAWLTNSEERGRAVGLLTGAYSLGGLLGGFLAGAGFAGGLSFAQIFLAGALLDLVGFALLWRVLRSSGLMPSPVGSTAS